MSATQPSVTGSPALTPAMFFDSENMVQLTRGYERLVRGFINTAVQQVEMARTWVEGGMADISLLAQARTPDAFVHAELEVLRRRSERALHAAQQITEQISRVWTETSSLTQPSINGSAGHVPESAHAIAATVMPNDTASRGNGAGGAIPIQTAFANQPAPGQSAASESKSRSSRTSG